MAGLPEVLAAKREEREWQREEARRKANEEEAKTKRDELRREEAEGRRKAEELRYRIPMAWIGAVMTVVPLIWTLRTEQDRYEETMAKREYEAARSIESQRTSILTTFSTVPFAAPQPDKWCERPEDEEFIRDTLIYQVGQLIVLEGPSGTGKSSLVKKVLTDAAATTEDIVVVHYDLRPEMPPTPDHFLHGFLRAVGYVIEPPGTDDFVKNKEKGLETLSDVLKQAAARGKKPILFLDNVDSIENLLRNPDGPVRIVMNKLLEMANSDLLNVVITASVATSKLHLDEVVMGWRSRRTLYFLSSWGPVDAIRDYVERINLLDPHADRQVTDSDIRMLHHYVGINLNDLNSIISQYKATGVPIRDIVNTRIIEEDHRITGLLGRLNGLPSDEVRSELKVLGHYLRIWNLMEKLTTQDHASGAINEKELAAFPEDEIEWCIKNDLITIERISAAKGQQSGYTITAEKPLVLHGMRSYMASPQVQMRKEEFTLRYATIKKEELFETFSRIQGMANGNQDHDLQTQYHYYKEVLNEYTAIQETSRKRLRDLRNITETSHLVLQNE